MPPGSSGVAGSTVSRSNDRSVDASRRLQTMPADDGRHAIAERCSIGNTDLCAKGAQDGNRD
jgi:hypothetical protein